MEATESQLAEVEEIGDVIAKSVHAFFASEFGRQIVADLKQLGLNMGSKAEAEAAAARLTSGLLSGKTLVVTGTLAKFKRDEIHAMIQKHGGRPSGSVSKNTDFLIAGTDAGSKLEKAQSLGVQILSEDEFLAMIGEG